MKKHLMATLLIGVCFQMIGCDAPEGDSSGRVEPHRTTASERHASGMVVGDMRSTSDDVARELVADLNRVIDEEVVDPSVRIWVTYGDIVNESATKGVGSMPS